MKKLISKLCKGGIVLALMLLVGAFAFGVVGSSNANELQGAKTCISSIINKNTKNKANELKKKLEEKLKKQAEEARIKLQEELKKAQEKLKKHLENVLKKPEEPKKEEPHEDTTESETHEDVEEPDFDVDWEGYQAWQAGYNGVEYDFDKVPSEYRDEIISKYEEGKNAYLLDQED